MYIGVILFEILEMVLASLSCFPVHSGYSTKSAKRRLRKISCFPVHRGYSVFYCATNKDSTACSDYVCNSTYINCNYDIEVIVEVFQYLLQ